MKLVKDIHLNREDLIVRATRKSDEVDQALTGNDNVGINAQCPRSIVLDAKLNRFGQALAKRNGIFNSSDIAEPRSA